MSALFFDAIKTGDRLKVESLLRENPRLIYEKEDGISPILLAAYHNEPGIADLLAEKTVALSIFEAAVTGKTASVILLLAREPQLINSYSPDGFQPLGLASFFGHYGTAEFLIKAGASVNSYSNNPLHAAPLQSATAGRHLPRLRRKPVREARVHGEHALHDIRDVADHRVDPRRRTDDAVRRCGHADV